MTKISELPIADALAGDELVPVVQGGVTKQVAAAALAASGFRGIELGLLATTAAPSTLSPFNLDAILFNSGEFSDPVLPSASVFVPAGVSKVRASARGWFDGGTVLRRLVVTLYRANVGQGTMVLCDGNYPGTYFYQGRIFDVQPGDEIRFRAWGNGSNLVGGTDGVTGMTVEIIE